MATLILMRHGESEWNRLNFFTGWVDVPLSPKGIEEALEGGRAIAHLPIDLIFTSTLMRAETTAQLAMSVHQGGRVAVLMHPGEGKLEEWSQVYGQAAKEALIPIYRSSCLNERMYGELQGLNKDETRARFGADQVKIWRRSYDVAPPHGESLADTVARAYPYFEETIAPCLKAGKNVFISAHGNSLRAIVMVLDKLSKEEVLNLEIPTGKPFLYTYENGIYTKS